MSILTIEWLMHNPLRLVYSAQDRAGLPNQLKNGRDSFYGAGVMLTVKGQCEKGNCSQISLMNMDTKYQHVVSVYQNEHGMSMWDLSQ